jgi:hypothetical protein
MTRDELKKMFRDMRPHPIRPEMMGHPLLVRIMRINENASIRYERDKRELYKNKALTDDQRSRGLMKALARLTKSWNKTRPLEREYERKVKLPMLKRLQALNRASRARVAKP